jgi:hypothetical protein
MEKKRPVETEDEGWADGMDDEDIGPCDAPGEDEAAEGRGAPGAGG